MIIATGDGQQVVATGSCIERGYFSISEGRFHKGCIYHNGRSEHAFNDLNHAHFAYTYRYDYNNGGGYSRAAAVFPPGTHTVLMRLEALPETDADWEQFLAGMYGRVQYTGNPMGAYFVYAAFKVDLGPPSCLTLDGTFHGCIPR